VNEQHKHVGELLKEKATDRVGCILSVSTEEECGSDGRTHQHELSMTVRWFDGLLQTLDRSKIDSWDDMYVGHESTSPYIFCTPALFVNVYITDRAYGGPEEGGWYYDTWEIIPEESVIGTSEEDAERLLEEKRAWADAENKGRRGPSSVRSEGHYKVRLETGPGASGDNYSPYC